MFIEKIKATFRKYWPHVYLAKTNTLCEKGDIIDIDGKYRTKEYIVHNLIAKDKEFYFYSVIPVDGYDYQARAAKKAEKLKGYAENARKRGDVWREKANEGKDFFELRRTYKSRTP